MDRHLNGGLRRNTSVFYSLLHYSIIPALSSPLTSTRDDSTFAQSTIIDQHRRDSMSDNHSVPESPELLALHARLADYSLGGRCHIREQNPDLVDHLWTWTVFYTCLM